jgi:hypothetical protein
MNRMLILVCAVLSACSNRSSRGVQFADVVKTPAVFQGQKIQIEGVIVIRVELYALIPAQQNISNSSVDESIWIDLEHCKVSKKDIANVIDKKVLVDGTFEFSEKPVYGHFSQWTKQLTKIERIKPVLDR